MYIYALILLVLLVFMGSNLFRSQAASKSVNTLLIWSFLILALTFGYGQYERIRFAPVISGEGTVFTIPKHNIYNGFVLKLALNGKSVNALIDTGATEIVLSHDDALSAGIDVMSLSFDQEVSTANGVTHYANAKLSQIFIGDFEVAQGVNVMVAPQDALDITLLGLKFLQLAKHYEVSNQIMKLTFSD